MSYTVLLAVGGSGGHLLPAQQLALLLKGEAKVVFAGSGLSKNPFFQKGNFFSRDIASAPLRSPVRFLRQSFSGLFQSLRFLREIKPDVVVGFGSYHTFPVLMAAVLLRKKIVLYEANSVLGKVNRLFVPFAKTLALQFPLQKQKMANQQYVSYFPWIFEASSLSKKEALSFYGLDSSSPVCLVFGGSQGAAFLNEKAPFVLSGCQVIHCTGKAETIETVRLAYEKQNIRAFVQAFEPNMARAYRAADFALCRSGAGTTAELIRYQLPAVMVPFPHAAENHQMYNAQFFCKEALGGFYLQQNEERHLRSFVEQCLSQLDSLRQSLQLFYQKTDKRVGLADLVKSVGS